MMAVFAYTIQANGGKRSGTVEADSHQAAVAQLRGQGALILEIRPATADARPTNGMSAGVLQQWADRLLVTSGSIELALGQLGSLLAAGVPIMTALRSIGRTSPPRLARAVLNTAEAIRNGQAFSKALEKHLPAVGKVTIALLAVGEANGTIDTMADYSARIMERSRKIRGQIMQALAYPLFVMLAALGVGYYMVQQVFPVVMKFIQKSRGSVELPLPTRLVIGLNDFLVTYGAIVLIAPFAAVALVVLLRRTANTGELVDGIALKVPLLGGAFRFHANTMWCLTLGALLSSGLDVIAAVDLVKATMTNWVYASQFGKVREVLRQGGSVSRGIEETSLKNLCPMARTMVAVSEESGNLDESLKKVADYSEERLTRRVAVLSKLVEPAVFIFVGGLVGLVYFGFFMAILAATRAAR